MTQPNYRGDARAIVTAIPAVLEVRLDPDDFTRSRGLDEEAVRSRAAFDVAARRYTSALDQQLGAVLDRYGHGSDPGDTFAAAASILSTEPGDRVTVIAERLVELYEAALDRAARRRLAVAS